jgi:predicted glycosyltransferase
VHTWRKQGIYELLETLYDHILVYGMREIFDPIAAYRFPAALAERTHFMGYVTETDEPETPSQRSFYDALPHPLVVVSVGSADGAAEPVVGTYLEMLRRFRRGSTWSVVLTDPLPDGAAGVCGASARRR